MRFIEVLKAVRNKFIRRKDKTQPEANQKKPEVQEVPEVPKKAKPEHDRLVRRYRAFAYHHRKSRIRKKYMKKLIEISPTDRFLYCVRQYGISAHDMQESVCRIGVDYSTRTDFTPGSVGSRKTDHGDSRIKGGIL